MGEISDLFGRTISLESNNETNIFNMTDRQIHTLKATCYLNIICYLLLIVWGVYNIK